MLPNVTFAGLDRAAPVEAIVHRWVTRLDVAQRLSNCEVVIRVASGLFGFGKRAHVEIAISTRRGRTIAVARAVRYRDLEDLYAPIADAFRAVHRELTGRTVNHRTVPLHAHHA